MSEAVLRIDGLQTYYGKIHALKGISVDVPRGGIACLIGANGAGKSTTLMTICGVQPSARGEILFEGAAIQGLRPERIAARGISQVPEGRQIFPLMTTLENLEMGAYLRKDSDGISRDLERVYDLFPVLRERRSQLGGTLSGGEQQMLAIGRGLMSRPSLLLLDEPSLGLAPMLVERIFDTIQEINRGGTTMFLVEQNAHIALSVSSRGYVMETGKVVLSGPSGALLENDQVKKAYLGE